MRLQRVFATLCGLASLAAAARSIGQQDPEKTIPTIARNAGKAVVLVVAKDCPDNKMLQGSGFIVSSDGKVVTNFHVIKGYSSAVVKFADGAYYKIAGILATDPTKDIAILKVDASAKEFPFLVMADSDQAQVGDHVVTIGNPLALQELTGDAEISTESTVSDGIISGKRDWEGHGITILQTTAPISHGSSGGALLNLQGQVLGITTLTSEGQNINFAVPVRYVTSMLSAETVRPLGQVGPAESEQPHEENSLNQFVGTYTGTWQSSRYGNSGVAVLSVTMDSGVLKARVAIIGSPVPWATRVIQWRLQLRILEAVS
jgi:S1-C subfamily serine protease